MDKVALIRHEIEKRRVHNLAIGNPLFKVMAEEDIELLCFIDSLQEEPKKCMYSKDDYTDEDRKVLCDGCKEECKYNKSDDFTKALAECIHQAQGNVVDPMVLAETWKGELIKLAKSEEPASKDKFTFTSLPRLLDRIKPTDRAKWYSSRLADTLEKEGYVADAKIVRESIKLMNGEKVPMATMDEEPVSEDLEEAAKEWLRPQLDKSYANCGEVKMMELTHFDGYAMLDAIEFGAQWQKEKVPILPMDLGEYINELSKQFQEVSFAKLSRIAVRVAKWQKENLWKPADGDDLPEIDREVIVLIQDYPDDKDHLRVAFAHRPSKYTKVWNSDLGEEQVVEIEGYDKGGWNIPNVKYWLDCSMPKEIEL